MPILLITITCLRAAAYAASERSRAGAFFRRIGVDQLYSKAPGLYGGVGSGNAFRSSMCDVLLTSKSKLDKAAGHTRKPSTSITILDICNMERTAVQFVSVVRAPTPLTPAT